MLTVSLPTSASVINPPLPTRSIDCWALPFYSSLGTPLVPPVMLVIQTPRRPATQPRRTPSRLDRLHTSRANGCRTRRPTSSRDGALLAQMAPSDSPPRTCIEPADLVHALPSSIFGLHAKHRPHTLAASCPFLRKSLPDWLNQCSQSTATFQLSSKTPLHPCGGESGRQQSLPVSPMVPVRVLSKLSPQSPTEHLQ